MLSILLLTAVFALTLVMFEAAGRFYVGFKTAKMPVDFNNLQANNLHEYDARLGWFPRKNARFFLPYKVTTNSLGLRNKELRPMEGQVRILALGDSRTFGDGVADEESWPFLLEQKLNAVRPNRFEVINAGVCGWNSLQGLKYLETRGLALNPHLVVCAFGANDWASVGPGQTGWIDWDDLVSRWGVEVLLREAAKGCAALIADAPFGPREFRVSPGEYTDALVRMQQLCQQQGVAFLVLYLPARDEIGIEDDSDYIFKIKCLSRGVAQYTFSAFIDPSGYFSCPADSFYVDPTHFSLTGNTLVAACLFDFFIAKEPQ